MLDVVGASRPTWSPLLLGEALHDRVPRYAMLSVHLSGHLVERRWSAETAVTLNSHVASAIWRRDLVICFAGNEWSFRLSFDPIPSAVVECVLHGSTYSVEREMARETSLNRNW